MYDRILVPLDGSELAEKALPYAQEMASRLRSELVLLHICSPNEQQLHHVHQIYLNCTAASAESQMKATQKSSARAGVKAKPVVVHGEPAQGIIDYAEKNDINLIVMATHGRSGLSRWAWGSVTERVLRGTSKPLTLVRAKTAVAPQGLWEKILVPLDGSKTGEVVLPYVAELALRLKSQLVLFQVIPSVQEIYSVEAYAHAIFTDEQLALVRADARNYLAGVARELMEQKVAAEIAVGSGSPAQEILNYAKEVSASVIAMATHGRSGVGRWVFGSVADRVLHEGGIPVMLVRATPA